MTKMKSTKEIQTQFMADLADEFKGFVAAAVSYGVHEGHEDHLEFLAQCMQQFIDLKNQDDDDE